MRSNSKLANIYLGFMLLVMYLPIVIVIVYSFNSSRISSVWGGFSLKWYEELLRDRPMFDAAKNSLVLATSSSVLAAIIGTLAAVGMPHVNLRGKGVVEYISTLPIMIPEIILGMVFFSLLCFDWITIWNGDARNSPYILLHTVHIHAGKS